MGRLLLLALPIALAVYALFDVIAARPHATRRGPKALWAAAVLLLPVVGPVAWFILGRPRRPPRTMAPDDDLDFLRKLRELGDDPHPPA